MTGKEILPESGCIQDFLESTCPTIFAEPLPSVVACLRSNGTVAELLANLPDSIDGRERDTASGWSRR